jgi:osmotically-inducible protein OsmY
MGRLKPFHVLALVAIQAAALCGCATYHTYRKCGFDGCPGDASIAAEVRALLDQHRALGPPNQVYVQSLDRVVYLTGQVATDLQRSIADSTAREAPGVREVVDTIALGYSGR